MTFGPEPFPDFLPSATTMSCSYYITNSGPNYQLRIRYLDFPRGTSCEDLSFTIYDGLSTANAVVRRICSDEQQCSEFVIPVPHRCLVKFEVSNKVTESFRGFVAVLEEVP